MKRIPVHNRHLISIQRPILWVISGLLILICILIILWTTFEYGRYQAGFDQSDTDEVISSLQQQIAELSERNDNLHRQNAKLKRDRNIDLDAGGQVEKELARTQAKILEMKEELAFYRSIVSPKKSKRSIEVNKVQLVEERQNQFKYKVVLIQDGRHDRAVRGMVELSFEGRQADGAIVRLALPTISVKKVKKQQRFGFKYFQNFEGSIRFPENFAPISMFVRVMPSSKLVPRINKSFTWDEITTGGDEVNVGQTEN